MAVLPFKDLTGEPSRAYFAAGVTDEIRGQPVVARPRLRRCPPGTEAVLAPGMCFAVRTALEERQCGLVMRGDTIAVTSLQHDESILR